MRVFVLVDIEGVAGVVSGEDTSPGNGEYERARRLMTGEASAVVAGILDAAPDAQVTVADAHGPYRNIIPEELDPRATLLRGKPAFFGMVDGIDATYGAAMFVGVHGQAGAGSSTLSHTFTGVILDVRLNGNSYGELGLNAAAAGAYGVPVLLVAGDQIVDAEAQSVLGPGVTTVIVKESRGHARADSPHPTVAQERLRAAATKSMRIGTAVPFRPAEPVDIEVDLSRPAVADMAAIIDGVERVNGRTIRTQRATVLDAYRFLRLVTLLCSVPV
jgi:D-amino peptidase